MGHGSTSVIQITNIAPTVTNEQLRTLFSYVGAIKEFVVYPSNDPSQQISRVCYVKFLDSTSVSVAQHLTNTVFIDRAIFVKPSDGKIPDESLALKLANEGHSQNSSNSGVVSQIANVNGIQSITTIDPRLSALGLPQYPPLPASMDPSKIEEIRRTVSVSNVSKNTLPEELLEFFNQFGEVNYLRMTSNENDIIKSALIEFTDQSSVANALQNTGIILNGSQLNICHSSTNILKPQYKLNNNEKFFESRESKKRPREPSRSPSHRRSRSPARKRSRTPIRSRDRRRSISGSRSPIRERRRRSRSREKAHRRSRSYSKSDIRSREKSRRDRSKDRDRRLSSRDRSLERRRSRDLDSRRRERSRDKHRDRSKERDRDRKRDRDRSHESERKHRSKRDRERRRSRSTSKSKHSSKSSHVSKDKLEIEKEVISKEDIDLIADKKSLDAESSSIKSEQSSSRKSSSPHVSNSKSRSNPKSEKDYNSEDEKY